MLKKLILGAMLIVLGLSQVGCQTIHGFGGDLEWLGQKISGDGEK
jgi:predicted small secreted protein